MTTRPNWLTMIAVGAFVIGVWYIGSAASVVLHQDLDLLRLMGYQTRPGLLFRTLYGLVFVLAGMAIGIGPRFGWWFAATLLAFSSIHWVMELSRTSAVDGHVVILGMIVVLAGTAFIAMGRPKAMHYFGFSRTRAIPFLVTAMLVATALAGASMALR